MIISRTALSQGCPYCKAGKPCPHNNLETRYPQLVKEWHPTKNIWFKLSEISPGSNTKVWWKCVSSHEWEATVGSRALNRNGCPSDKTYSKAQID